MKKNKPKSKTQIILDHFLAGKSITTFLGFELYAETKLSNKISTLRKRGYKIVDVNTQYWEPGLKFPPKRYYIDEFLSLDERAKYNLPYQNEEEQEDE